MTSLRWLSILRDCLFYQNVVFRIYLFVTDPAAKLNIKRKNTFFGWYIYVSFLGSTKTAESAKESSVDTFFGWYGQLTLNRKINQFIASVSVTDCPSKEGNVTWRQTSACSQCPPLHWGGGHICPILVVTHLFKLYLYVSFLSFLPLATGGDSE